MSHNPDPLRLLDELPARYCESLKYLEAPEGEPPLIGSKDVITVCRCLKLIAPVSTYPYPAPDVVTSDFADAYKLTPDLGMSLMALLREREHRKATAPRPPNGDEKTLAGAGAAAAATLAVADGSAVAELADRGESAKGSLKPPPGKAWQAWQTKTFMGITNQTEIANTMTKYGVPATQGEVSRWLKQVDQFFAAGGQVPPMPDPLRAATVDPSVIEQGERQDHRTRDQRKHRDANAD